MIFGLIPSGIGEWVQYGLLVLHHVLRRMPQARVKWPESQQQFDILAGIVKTRCPDLDKTWGMIDGLNLGCLNSTNEVLQNSSYNGWLHGTFVSSVLIFTPDGCISWYATNAPGSFHDCKICAYGGLWGRLRDKVPDGFTIVADSAFPRTDSNVVCPGKIIRVRKEGEPLPPTTLGVRQERQAASVRQGAEWGMRAVQGLWHRLHSNTLEDHMKAHRRIILEVCFKMFNYRTRVVGLNQIQTFWAEYMSESGMQEVYNEFS
jgi:hypothetical protein